MTHILTLLESWRFMVQIHHRPQQARSDMMLPARHVWPSLGINPSLAWMSGPGYELSTGSGLWVGVDGAAWERGLGSFMWKWAGIDEVSVSVASHVLLDKAGQSGCSPRVQTEA